MALPVYVTVGPMKKLEAAAAGGGRTCAKGHYANTLARLTNPAPPGDRPAAANAAGSGRAT